MHQMRNGTKLVFSAARARIFVKQSDGCIAAGGSFYFKSYGISDIMVAAVNAQQIFQQSARPAMPSVLAFVFFAKYRQNGLNQVVSCVVPDHNMPCWQRTRSLTMRQ